jgi:hypothetical protein
VTPTIRMDWDWDRDGPDFRIVVLAEMEVAYIETARSRGLKGRAAATKAETPPHTLSTRHSSQMSDHSGRAIRLPFSLARRTDS